MNTQHKHHFYSDFLLCGLCGWCMECFWTGLSAIRGHQDKTLMCHTSVWMFPIYGLAACLSPVCNAVKQWSAPLRSMVYALCIFTGEFLTGSLLKRYEACPWDYSKAKFNYKGIIRFDYAPAWAVAGLIFERILKR